MHLEELEHQKFFNYLGPFILSVRQHCRFSMIVMAFYCQDPDLGPCENKSDLGTSLIIQA